MTTTPHHAPGRTGPHPTGPGSLVAGLGHPGAAFVPLPRRPDTVAEQPYLRFPTADRPSRPAGRSPAPAAVLAARVVGLCLTMLCAFAPAWFGLMAVAFGLGLANGGGVAFGAVMGAVAIAWPLGFWFTTSRARRVWPVLVALVPTMLVAGAGVWLWIAG
jgi:hypothetical protein